jgi:hypothetical protein
MLEGVIESRHLNELNRPLEISGEPELLKMSYVPEVPEDRAHQRIVLHPEIVIGERRQQQEGTSAGLFQLPGDGLTFDCTGEGYGSH